MAKRIGVARCSFCGYKTTTGGISGHVKHCLKNPKNSNPMTDIQEKAEESPLKKYGQHLSNCNLNQDWTPAYQAMADTPNEYRDESYHIALQEMEVRRSKCTCGFTEALEPSPPTGEPVEDQEGLWDELTGYVCSAMYNEKKAPKIDFKFIKSQLQESYIIHRKQQE